MPGRDSSEGVHEKGEVAYNVSEVASHSNARTKRCREPYAAKNWVKGRSESP